MGTALSWAVPLVLFSGLWLAFMRYVGAPVTWSAVVAVAAIVALVAGLQQRLWWLAVPAGASLIAAMIFLREPRRRS